MKYSEDKIQEVRDATDIVEVISQYVSLKKRGKGFTGLCPFHEEKTPSFHVDPVRSFYHCFGCHEGGNVFTFLMKMERVGFPEALRSLAEKAGITLPRVDSDNVHEKETEALYHAHQMAADFFKQCLYETKGGKKALEYLKNRGFDSKEMQQFDLGYAPNLWDGLIQKAQRDSVPNPILHKGGLIREKQNGKGFIDRFRGRLMFPIKSPSGRIIAFGGRTLIEGDRIPKYLNSPETQIYHKSYVLYGLYEARDAIRKKDSAIFVEGYTDVMRMHQCGFENCIATSGTALTPEQTRLVRRYTQNVILLFDGDSAGLSAALRGVDILLNAGLSVRIAPLSSGEDPDSFLKTKGIEALQKMIDQAMHFIDFEIDLLKKNKQFETSTDKARASRQLVESVSNVQDTVERALFIQEIAEKLNVEEKFLIDHLKPVEKDEVKKIEETQAQSLTRLAEQGILQVLLQDGVKTAEVVYRFVEPEDFEHLIEKELFQNLKESYLKGKILELESLQKKYIDQPAYAHFFTELSLKQIEDEEKRLQYGMDCVIQLKSHRIKSKISEIQIKLKSSSDGQEIEKDKQIWMDLQTMLRSIQSEIENTWKKTVEF